MPLSLIKNSSNLAQEIYDKIGMKKGVLPDGFEVFGNRVLVATFDRPEKTKGGILLTEQTRAEEKNQGKACLVVAKGPTAFRSDDNYDFCDQNIEVGDWISLFVYESKPIVINGHACRIVRDSDIAMKIPSPDAIF
jgi:co-chaperonin GroES (HSP10)